MNREYPMWLEIKNVITSGNHNYNLMIIGDSRAKAGIIPKILDGKNINSYNFSLGGSTPIEGYFTLKKYLENNTPPEYLILSYVPSHFAMHDAYWGGTISFGFLNYFENDEVFQVATLLNDPILGKNMYLEFKLHIEKYVSALKNGILSQRWKSNGEALKYVKKSKGHYFYGRRTKASGLNYEVSQKNFYPSPLLNYYFKKLAKLANSKNIKICWYAMPFNKSSFKKLNNTYKIQYNKYIQRVLLDYNFTVLQNLYYMDDSNFGDPSHLYRGAKKVTRDIKAKLIKLKNIDSNKSNEVLLMQKTSKKSRI